MNKPTVNIFWFRRDLRLEDNTGLHAALQGDLHVLPLFIFDRNILDDIEDKSDARVAFIHSELMSIEAQLTKKNAGILTKYGHPLEIWQQLLVEYDIKQVYTNRDYEPYALQRDNEIEGLLKANGIAFNTFKDHVIFEPHEVVKEDGQPYSVFTPYSKVWRNKLMDTHLEVKPSALNYNNFFQAIHRQLTLKDLGFQNTYLPLPSRKLPSTILLNYAQERDYPAKMGTSRLGLHLRFGTVSIRAVVKKALATSEVYLNELIWREFYQMILWHHPRVIDGNFKTKYNYLEWQTNEADFQAWCDGQTGYPIVDAGMRELNSTGFMHNRLRMITGSFLTKHLLIDWRWGEAYFANKLLDFELASNNGGWQWAAGTGTDAQPYFRIFNPTLQTKKFDPQLEYIKKWVPEFQQLTYSKPIVEHKYARERCLSAFKKVLAPTP
jgi:deoxyribodipyrimidine photo-lyase